MKTFLVLLLLIPGLSWSSEDLGGTILNCDIEFGYFEDEWVYRGYIFNSKFHKGEEGGRLVIQRLYNHKTAPDIFEQIYTTTLTKINIYGRESLRKMAEIDRKTLILKFMHSKTSTNCEIYDGSLEELLQEWENDKEMRTNKIKKQNKI
tara:strand:- start:1433 stop:1879 length:447 start_codon:yes stop_codon:yes gene_type:complete